MFHLNQPETELPMKKTELPMKKLSKNFPNSFLKNNIPYTCKQPLMMAYEESESAWDNFGKFLHQFQPETKTLMRKFERILNELYRQNLYLLFNIYIYIHEGHSKSSKPDSE